jgi:hypothetical protein
MSKKIVRKIPDDVTDWMGRNTSGRGRQARTLIADSRRQRARPTDGGQCSEAGEPRLHCMNPGRNDHGADGCL